MQGRIAAVSFVAFIYVIVWLALAIVVVPDAIAALTESRVMRVLLNLGISGSLLAVPAYALYRMSVADPSTPAPGAKAGP